jgi:hypothetical protein
VARGLAAVVCGVVVSIAGTAVVLYTLHAAGWFSGKSFLEPPWSGVWIVGGSVLGLLAGRLLSPSVSSPPSTKGSEQKPST